MTRAYLGLGSNLGDRRAMLELAAQRLREAPGVRRVRMSPVYETAPVGPVEQGPFLNAALAIDTDLSPRQLLTLMRGIEAEAGRSSQTQRVRWGPRELDIDLLLYGGAVIDEPDLTVPHPRMHERRFVLEPLCDLAPDTVHPGSGQTASRLLAALGGDQPGAGIGTD